MEYNKQRVKRKVKQWKPQMVMTLGNHEHRINRAVQNDATLSGVLSTDHLNYAGQGWQVIPFLDVIEIDGVHYIGLNSASYAWVGSKMEYSGRFPKSIEEKSKSPGEKSKLPI